MDWKILDCTEQDGDRIADGLVAYNLRQVPMTQRTEFISVRKKIVDESGTILAGCLGEIYCWGIAHVSILWVDEPYRRFGFGSKLLSEVERTAVEEGCSLIHLDTFDFQAKDFYLKHGYEVFGVLEDCPKDHCRYYLKKKLK